MNELLQDITNCLENLQREMVRIQATVRNPADRDYFSKTMWRLSEACRETRAMGELLRRMKDKSCGEGHNNLEWTARLASLDTVNSDTRN